MDELGPWWEIAQLGGAGMAVVLGPLAWMFWRRIEADTVYIRQQDIKTSEVLLKLTNLLESFEEDTKAGHHSIITSIERSAAEVKAMIEKREKG